MASKNPEDSSVSLNPADIRPEMVAMVSQSQAGKVREILRFYGDIRELDPDIRRNLVDLMTASVADGGCGIGCW